MKRSINMPALAQGMLCVLLGLALLWLCLTHVYMQYVTPRTLPYLYFAAALLLVMGAYAFTRLRVRSHIRRYAHLLVLLIPLLLLGYATWQGKLWSSPLLPTQQSVSAGSVSGEYTMTIDGFQGRVLHGYDPQTQQISVSQEETYWWLSEIYTDPTPFLGFTISTMGQVLKDPAYFPQGTFSPTRKLMTCCVADTYIIGFKCQYAQADGLADGDWVSVRGKLALVGQGTDQELRLVADSVTPAAPPQQPYVYAY